MSTPRRKGLKDWFIGIVHKKNCLPTFGYIYLHLVTSEARSRIGKRQRAERRPRVPHSKTFGVITRWFIGGLSCFAVAQSYGETCRRAGLPDRKLSCCLTRCVLYHGGTACQKWDERNE